jgi:GNAT superfamily N-acetyltransferase
MIDRTRLGRETDAALLPAIERSAALSFQLLPDLAWILDVNVLGEAMHLGRIRKGTCWVAVDEDDIPIGFLSAERVAERELHIHEISVASIFQGRGLGRALIQAAVEWAATKRLAALTLTTFRDVPWNAPFYSRLGFKLLPADHSNTRLAAVLRKEVEEGFDGGRRCAMRVSLKDKTDMTPLQKS